MSPAQSSPRSFAVLPLIICFHLVSLPQLAQSCHDSYVAACVVSKDDNRDIKEWVEYYTRLGVGCIYLYDNNSTEPLINQLLEFVRAGIVEYHYLVRFRPREGSEQVQKHVYNLCLTQWGPRHRWMMFLDTDEFIVIRNGRLLPALMRDYEPYGGLGLNWIFYGSSGHDARPPGGVLENYSMCNIKGNLHIKTVLQPGRASLTLSPHHFQYVDGFRCVSTSKMPIVHDGPFHEPVELNVAYIAHFFTKSREDWHRKIRRGSAMHNMKKVAEFEIYDAEAADICPYVTMPLPSRAAML